MSFGKPPPPPKLLEEAHKGPETYEVLKLEAEMLNGVTLPCGCVARSRWQGEILRSCQKHQNKPLIR